MSNVIGLAGTNSARCRRVKEYEIYVPLVASDGQRFPAGPLSKLKKRLIARFGGLTYSPQKNEGYWRVDKATFYDEIIILRVISPNDAAARAFWKSLKLEMQKDWRQKTVLIVCRDIKII